MSCLCYDEGYKDGKVEAEQGLENWEPELDEVIDVIADLLKSPTHADKLVQGLDDLGWIIQPKTRCFTCEQETGG